MKLFKSTLRIWITITSVFAFLVGWVFLAHSPKPQPYSASGNTSTLGLPPVPSIDNLTGISSNSQGFQPIQSRAFSPRFRTAGS